MARQNVPFLAFNRGIVSQKALARVDLDRMRLSAEVMTNWLPKTQGAMTIRPGTKYLGSSYNDSGAEFLEFVAAVDDTALLELTHQKMRVWVSSDTGRSTGALAFESPVSSGLDVLLARPKVDTTLTVSDTGWSNTSTGGAISTAATDAIPAMTAATTGGVTISATSENTSGGVPSMVGSAWNAADDNTGTNFFDTGEPLVSSLPTWWKVDFGAANTKAVTSYSIRATPNSTELLRSPSVWSLQRSDDDAAWTAEDTQGSETGWAVGEKRTYRPPGADTGTIEARRYWRLNFTSTEATGVLEIAEIEMFTAATAQQVKLQAGKRVLNASSIGALARSEKRVIVSDTGTEHSLAIDIERGPVTLRVGSTQRDDDYISETQLGTGYHNLAFTPNGNFWVTLQTNETVDRIVRSISIGDSGTVELTTPIGVNNLQDVRYDQSADVIYVDCDDVNPLKIERRGTGRSWSVVKYQPKNGPFLSTASSSAKLSVSHFYGNTYLNSDIPFFTSNHVGALFRLFHGSQSGVWPLGALNAKTDAIRVTGISDTGDTGVPSQQSERRITVSVTGTYTGRIRLERSFEGAESGFHNVSTSRGYIKRTQPTTDTGILSTDTGTFSLVINDPDDNVKVWYRARMIEYTSGAALVSMTYPHGAVEGVGRVTSFDSNTQCQIEVLSRFSDTGTTDSWQEGAWSEIRGYPTAAALHSGRLSHAGGANVWFSVSDDYENFDDAIEGDAGPISHTLGSGPVNDIQYLISLLRLVIGTSGAEMAVRSSSLDEPITPSNSGVRTFSSQGSGNVRAIRIDNDAVFAQRSGKRLLSAGKGREGEIGEYVTNDLTMLAPDLLEAGIVSIAVQRQPDTRIHCVLADGTVGILTFEPSEDVIAWSTWETDGAIERVSVLPGTTEDRVYYHVNRTIGGTTKRFLERLAREDECWGDTGLSWLMDCAKSYTDTGRTASITGLSHLNGEAVVVWSDDTGQSYPSKDQSYDTGGVQKTYTVSGGTVTLGEAVHHAVVGLPYNADYKSTKLAYAAQAGTALTQMKRTDKIAFVLYKTHNNGLYFGNDTGTLDPLPRKSDGGAEVDQRKIFETFDRVSMPFPGLWSEDSRIHLRAKAPRPATVLAAVPTVQTNERP